MVCSTFFITVEADDIFIRLSSIKEGNVSMEGKWEKKKGSSEAFQELIGAYLSYGYLETKANEDFNN